MKALEEEARAKKEKTLRKLAETNAKKANNFAHEIVLADHLNSFLLRMTKEEVKNRCVY